MDLQGIQSSAAATRARALEALAGMASQADLDQFLALAHGAGPYDSYKVIAAPARTLVRRLAATAQVRIFLRAALASAVAATVASDRFRQLPPRVAAQQARHLARIAADADQAADWLDLDHDLFQKELGLATLRLYAAGAQLVDVRCGVPRSLVFKAGPAAALGTLAKMVKLGGFRPYFQIHTHKFDLGQFNEAGWDECYRCCAELYALHPRARGMFGSSWFYDPALDAISPRLGYLRATPLAAGAHLLFVEEGGDAVGNSLSTSPTRRQLYEAGRYQPKSYMLLWGKKEQMAWARAFKDAPAARA